MCTCARACVRVGTGGGRGGKWCQVSRDEVVPRWSRYWVRAASQEARRVISGMTGVSYDETPLPPPLTAPPTPTPLLGLEPPTPPLAAATAAFSPSHIYIYLLPSLAPRLLFFLSSSLPSPVFIFYFLCLSEERWTPARRLLACLHTPPGHDAVGQKRRRQNPECGEF